MSTQTSPSAFSPAQLAQIILGIGLATIVLCFGLLVWRVDHLAHSGHSAVKHQIASVHSTATPPQDEAVEEETVPIQTITPNVSPLLISGEEHQRRETDRNKPVVDSPPRLPKASIADLDQIFEQRLQASEDDLCGQLRDVPEMRLLNDDEVRKVREDERAAQKQIVAIARAQKNVARANWEVANLYSDYAARLVYDEATRRYDLATKGNLPEIQQIAYYSNVRLHQAMKQNAVRAGLELGSGPSCQLTPPTAAEVATLSKELRDMNFVTVLPGASFLRQNKRGMKEFQKWCDQHRLESLSGTVATLSQMLQIEDEATRLLLVRELTRIHSTPATVELTMRALADLSPAVRRAALAGLEQRPASQYVPMLLRALRYPWPPLADHAAVALRTLKPQEAVAPLVDLLDLPSPSAPVLDANTSQYKVREMVRLNHLRNCLLCHAPSANKYDGLVRGLVPTMPGEPLPVLYYEAVGTDFVRADITYLLQDFSVNLPVTKAAPWPKEQRFDFVTRLRTLTPNEVAQMPAASAKYPQRDAVLYALRGLTGNDGGDLADQWRKTLGFAVRATEKKKDAPLDKAITRPKD